MPRFVLLRHEVPRNRGKPSHWDLMLERDETTIEHRLVTWNLFDLPAAWIPLLSLPELKGMPFPLEAEQLADHRAFYLDYEGPVSNDRGTVKQVAAGDFRWIEANSNCYEAAILAPNPLKGKLVLKPVTSPSTASWLLEWVAM